MSINNTPLIPDEIAIPCGFMAKTLFMDQFILLGSEGNNIPIN